MDQVLIGAFILACLAIFGLFIAALSGAFGPIVQILAAFGGLGAWCWIDHCAHAPGVRK